MIYFVKCGKIIDMENEKDPNVLKVDGKSDVDRIADTKDDKLSKRPWSNAATEIAFAMPDGSTKKCWVMSVVDANGNMICFGKTEDMKFIREMENSFDGIYNMLEHQKSTTETSIELLKSFRKETD